MYAIYGNIYHQYTPNVSIYTIHGSYGLLVEIAVKLPVSSAASPCPGHVQLNTRQMLCETFAPREVQVLLHVLRKGDFYPVAVTNLKRLGNVR